MKKSIKLTESKLRNMIREAVTKTLNEGTTDETAYERWEYVKEMIGCENMLDDIFNWSSSDQIDEMLGWFEEEGYLEGYGEDY